MKDSDNTNILGGYMKLLRKDKGVKQLDVEEIIYYYQKMTDEDKQLIKMIVEVLYKKKAKE